VARVSGLKHEEIARVLGTEIRDGGLAHGSQLPGETTLAQRFGVSRNTVRAALNELARAGLISTRSGKGSYVTYDGRPLNVRLGWARALEAQGVPTRVSVLAADAVEAPALAAELGAASAGFYAIDRLRSLESGQVISYERSKVPASAALAHAVDRGEAAGSLTDMLVGVGLVASTGQQWVEVRHLSHADAALMHRTPGESFMWSRCITRNALGELVEDVESLLDPAHFRLHFQFSSQE
jgi:GntR family transcriptional regulator